MITQSSDTHPEAERVQIDIIRQASVARRISIVRSLSQTSIFLSRRAIARAHPELNEQKVDLLFVAYHYGDDLAAHLREYLEQGER